MSFILKIDYGLIMSAGAGTRMGLIGEVLPKVLWPIFDQTLLSLQIAKLKELGCEKIIVNGHFLCKQIETYLQEKKFNDVELFFEPALYGSGGTINELVARKIINNHGSLLYSAGDQFYFFDKNILKKGLDELPHYNSVLFALAVPKKSSYGALILQEGLLKSIESALLQTSDYITYSGLGLVNLKKIAGQRGYSEFFKTVAPLDLGSKVLLPKERNYWDFGTFDHYFTSIKKLYIELVEGEEKKQLSKLSQFSQFFLQHSSQKKYRISNDLRFVTQNGHNFNLYFDQKNAGIKYDGLFQAIDIHG